MLEHIIRKAVPADAKFISLLAKINFSESFGNLFSSEVALREYIDNTFSVAKMTASIQKSDTIFWIACVNSLPVGYVKLKKNAPVPNTDFKDAIELQKVYVLKDYIKEGNGIELKTAFFEKIQQLEAKRVWLKELHTNERTLNFYKKYDFHKHHSESFTIGKENFVFNIMLKNS